MDAVVVRCSRGGLFETLWWPWGSLRAVRLGSRRLQWCPVHRRLELVQRVDRGALTGEQRQLAAQHPAGRIP